MHSSPDTASLDIVYALLIGIDAYLPNPLCTPLAGAVADVDAMDEFLRARGVPAHQIERLTASPREPGMPDTALEVREAPERRPTYENILTGMARLGERAAAHEGGTLWIHFSGHGCRSRTLIPGSKGDRGFDEGLVPYDVGAGGTILHDVELAHVLHDLRRRGVQVTLILDACHAGGLLRTDGRPRPRGAMRLDRRPRRTHSAVAPLAELDVSWRRIHRRRYEDLALRAVDDAPKLGDGVALVAACRDREIAYEAPSEGRIRGALTWALLHELADLPDDRAERLPRLSRRLTAGIRRLGLQQTPLVHGTPLAPLLAASGGPDGDGPRILDVDPERLRILVDAGPASGLVAGTRLEIPGPDATGPAVAVITGEAPSATSTWAQIDADVPLPADLDRCIGDRVTVWEPSLASIFAVVVEPVVEPVVAGPPAHPPAEPARLRDGRPLRVTDPRWSDQAERLVDAFRQSLESRSGGLVRAIAADRAPDGPHARVRADPSGRLHIQTAGHPLLPVLPDPRELSLGTLTDPRRAIACLIHLARLCRLLRLRHDDPRSPLTGRLTLELAAGLSGPSAGSPAAVHPSGRPAKLVVVNRSPRSLHLLLLCVEPDGAARIVLDDPETLDPARALHLDVTPTLPAGLERGTLLYKAIATTTPLRAPWLAMPPLHRTLDRLGLRGSGAPSEDCVEDWAEDWAEERARLDLQRRVGAWVTADCTIEVGPTG